MKLLITTLFLLSINYSQACVIKLFKTSATSKTAYTAQGESISESMRKKLSGQCKFEMKLMSLEQKRQFDINKLQKRLKKLKTGLR